MKVLFSDKPQNYDGKQLVSHWILQTFGIYGNALVSFIGGAEVKEALVDWEDRLAGDFIYSEKMLHFIAEFFDGDLEKAVLRQHLFMSLLQQELNQKLGSFRVIRRGDDLFAGDGKLTVSIATRSPVSTLLHVGINIINRNTPVVTEGLENLQVDPIALAHAVMKNFTEELQDIERARCKVRPVS